MPIRKSLGKEAKTDSFVYRMLADAIKAQKAKVDEASEFGDSEDVIRKEHEYLTWLQRMQRHEGKITITLD